MGLRRNESSPKRDIRLVERLAVGGMAEVYLACDRAAVDGVGMLVVKRILPQLAQDASFVHMFLNEARIAARIRHPNVVRIYERGEASGYPFIAMEYVPGVTLKELILAAQDAGEHLPTEVVIDLIAQACDGAHAAHELVDSDGQPYGIVHRDLTPHNLMVTLQGHVKLLDFGIAKAQQGMDHTRTGMLKGKISYMSPEQCRQETLDRRSDVFTLGIDAWELLTGAKPFQGASELGTMQAIVTGERPSLVEVRPDVPPQVAAVVERALAAAPEDRMPTARDMRHALETAAREAGLEISRRRTCAITHELVGETVEGRNLVVKVALERTLPSLGEVHLLDPPTGEAELLEPDPTTEEVPIQRTRDRPLTVFVLGAILALVVAVLGVRLAARPTTEKADPSPVLTGAPIHVTLAPTLEPDVLLEEHDPIRRYLQRALLRPVIFDVASSYGEASRLLIEGDVPYAMLPYGTTRHTLSEAPNVRILAVKVIDGSASYDSYVIVPRDSDALTIHDLAGQTFCYTDRLSTSGYLQPLRYLEAQNLDPDRFTPHFSGNHDQVLRDLISGVCAVGGTYSNNFATADQRGIPSARLRILALIGATPHDAVCAGPTAEQRLTEALTRALLDFDPKRDVGVDRVGESERITGFAEPVGYADDL